MAAQTDPGNYSGLDALPGVVDRVGEIPDSAPPAYVSCVGESDLKWYIVPMMTEQIAGERTSLFSPSLIFISPATKSSRPHPRRPSLPPLAWEPRLSLSALASIAFLLENIIARLLCLTRPLGRQTSGELQSSLSPSQV